MSYTTLRKSYANGIIEHFDIYEFRGGGGMAARGRGGGGFGGGGEFARKNGAGGYGERLGEYDGRVGYDRIGYRGWDADWVNSAGSTWYDYGVPYNTPTVPTEKCFCQDADKLDYDYKICVNKDTCGVCVPCNDCNAVNFKYKRFCNEVP